MNAQSETLGRLHPRTAASLADLVRLMNCYYSNLIEGHSTTPRDIERALIGDLDAEEGRPNLQVEARAHIRSVQADSMMSLTDLFAELDAKRAAMTREERHGPSVLVLFEDKPTKALGWQLEGADAVEL